MKIKLCFFLAKCKKEVINTIKNSNVSIIIDSTNRNIKTRKVWLDLISCFNIKFRYIYLDVSKDLSLHINTYRSLTCDKKIPKIAIHSYYKQLQFPKSDEINELISLPFYLNRDILDFDLFNLYLS